MQYTILVLLATFVYLSSNASNLDWFFSLFLKAKTWKWDVAHVAHVDSNLIKIHFSPKFCITSSNQSFFDQKFKSLIQIFTSLSYPVMICSLFLALSVKHWFELWNSMSGQIIPYLERLVYSLRIFSAN